MPRGQSRDNRCGDPASRRVTSCDGLFGRNARLEVDKFHPHLASADFDLERIEPAPARTGAHDFATLRKRAVVAWAIERALLLAKVDGTAEMRARRIERHDLRLALSQQKDRADGLRRKLRPRVPALSNDLEKLGWTANRQCVQRRELGLDRWPFQPQRVDQHGHSRSDWSENGAATKHCARGAFEKVAAFDGWGERWIGRSWVGHPPDVSMGKMVYVKNAGGELTTKTSAVPPKGILETRGIDIGLRHRLDALRERKGNLGRLSALVSSWFPGSPQVLPGKDWLGDLVHFYRRPLSRRFADLLV